MSSTVTQVQLRKRECNPSISSQSPKKYDSPLNPGTALYPIHFRRSPTRSSSREVRIRVPLFAAVYFSRGTLPTKKETVKGHLVGDLAKETGGQLSAPPLSPESGLGLARVHLEGGEVGAHLFGVQLPAELRPGQQISATQL